MGVRTFIAAALAAVGASLRLTAALAAIAIAIPAAVAVRGQMATADRVQAAGWWPTKGVPARAEYVGAAACARCHAARAATQATTSMARTMTRAHLSDPLRAHPRLTFTDARYMYEIVTTDQQSVYSVTDGKSSDSAPLTWAFGVGKIGQSFLFERDGAFHEARVSYYDSIDALDLTPARGSPPQPRSRADAMARTVGAAEVRRCFACHATASVANRAFDPSAATLGVTCEACHGPGRRHVDAMSQHRAAEGKTSILNPASLEPADSVDFCGACHATFWDVKLADEKGIAALRSQPYRLLSSKCWGQGDPRITCIACHNPHVPLVRDAAAYDARCLSCHVEAGGLATRERTARPCTVGRTGCVTCHMPKYEVREMHHDFTDHLIRIVRARP